MASNFRTVQRGTLEYCNIKKAYYGVFATYNSDIHEITNCNITNNKYGIYYELVGNTRNPISNNTISNNTSYGIYLFYSAPDDISENIISNNPTGIYVQGLAPQIIDNYIYPKTPGVSYGIYCTSSANPYIYYNKFGSSGGEYWNADVLYCTGYSPAKLKQPSGSGENEVFGWWSIHILADYSSHVNGNDGYNCFPWPDLLHIYAKNYSHVQVKHNYWGGSAPGIATQNGGTVDYDPYEPNCGIAKIASGDKEIINTTASSNFFDEQLQTALNKMDDGKYEEAITLYKQLYENKSNTDIKQYILAQLYSCYTNAGRSDFIDFLNNQVRKNISTKDNLYATTLELENFSLLRQGQYKQAIENYKILLNDFSDNAETVKHALYNLGSVYFHQLGDTIEARKYFNQLIKKYPDDDLTFQAVYLLDEEENFEFLEKSGKEQITTKHSTIPKKFALYENFPNPFNPTTTIQYDLPEDANVIITVYNNTGKKIKELVNGFKQAGSYQVVFDAQGLSSGIYFYRIKAGIFTDVKRMLLLK
jgi:parallel beta-helix repeat protein